MKTEKGEHCRYEILSSMNFCSTSSYSYVAQVLTTWPLRYYCAVCQLEKAKDAMFESAIVAL